MAYVPALFRKTRSVQRINSYMDTVFDEVLHTTLNPNGPGAIRIHLIPPKKEENTLNPSVAIINGTRWQAGLPSSTAATSYRSILPGL